MPKSVQTIKIHHALLIPLKTRSLPPFLKVSNPSQSTTCREIPKKYQQQRPVSKCYEKPSNSSYDSLQKVRMTVPGHPSPEKVGAYRFLSSPRCNRRCNPHFRTCPLLLDHTLRIQIRRLCRYLPSTCPLCRLRRTKLSNRPNRTRP